MVKVKEEKYIEEFKIFGAVREDRERMDKILEEIRQLKSTHNVGDKDGKLKLGNILNILGVKY